VNITPPADFIAEERGPITIAQDINFTGLKDPFSFRTRDECGMWCLSVWGSKVVVSVYVDSHCSILICGTFALGTEDRAEGNILFTPESLHICKSDKNTCSLTFLVSGSFIILGRIIINSKGRIIIKT
jgi:hypothetical protein